MLLSDRDITLNVWANSDQVERWRGYLHYISYLILVTFYVMTRLQDRNPTINPVFHALHYAVGIALMLSVFFNVMFLWEDIASRKFGK
jgi:hypothetical protein